jgi:hypothetical protein
MSLSTDDSGSAAATPLTARILYCAACEPLDSTTKMKPTPHASFDVRKIKVAAPQA